MDAIPPEIRTKIIDHVQSDVHAGARLAPLASISRLWKSSVEHHTFRKIHVATTDLEYFESLFNGNNISRRAALKSLSVDFILPAPPKGNGCCELREGRPDREADGSSFSISVKKLFSVLSDLASRLQDKEPLALIFQKTQRLGNAKHRVYPKPWPYKRHSEGDAPDASMRRIIKARVKSGMFSFRKDELIPKLPDVTQFEYWGLEHFFFLEPSWIPEVIALLPGLEKLYLYVEDSYSLGRNQRVLRRHSFEKAFCCVRAEGLEEIIIKVPNERLRNENTPVQELIDSSECFQETWYKVLRHLSYFPSLTKLNILDGATIHPEIFRSITDHPNRPFPALRELVFEFSPETADGKWFYQKDEEAFRKARDLEEYEDLWCVDPAMPDAYNDFAVFEKGPQWTHVVRRDFFRSLPDSDTLLPLLMGAAAAANCLPELRKFILRLNDGAIRRYNAVNRDYPFIMRALEVWYLKAGTHRSTQNVQEDWTFSSPWPKVACDAKYINRNRLYWVVGDWSPWEDVKAAWLTVAGPNAKVVFLEHEQWTHEGNDRDIYEGKI